MSSGAADAAAQRAGGGPPGPQAQRQARPRRAGAPTRAARAGRIADGGGVKMHAFEPSGRRVWTVVGEGEEHWVDPDRGYCSCPAFRFALLRGGAGSCYHLDAVRSADSRERPAVTMFSDDEYAGLVAGLLPRLRR